MLCGGFVVHPQPQRMFFRARRPKDDDIAWDAARRRLVRRVRPGDPQRVGELCGLGQGDTSRPRRDVLVARRLRQFAPGGEKCLDGWVGWVGWHMLAPFEFELEFSCLTIRERNDLAAALPLPPKLDKIVAPRL